MRVPFMGLFDTVASVGVPMSTNNTSVVGAAASSVSYCIEYRLTNRDLAPVRPVRLAFAEGARPGADPAVGMYDGHSNWGALMRIPDMVEEVRHFVAGHEIRNSFPLDSVSVVERGGFRRNMNFHETVYPGAHSDVGGSYRRGEGGRSFEAGENIGVIPLSHMYEFAIGKGVPLLPRHAWENFQKNDFNIQETVRSSFNHYMAQLPKISSLGLLLTSHMALYLAWRFRSIRRKLEGDASHVRRIAQSRAIFEPDENARKQQLALLEAEFSNSKQNCYRIRSRRTNAANGWKTDAQSMNNLKRIDAELNDAEIAQSIAQDRYLRARAQLHSIPDMRKFAAMLDMYDQRLMLDVKDIRQSMENSENNKTTKKRAELRPHYRMLIEAYENEFIHGKGLADTQVIAFFDEYIHDSLAGFAKDATLPSDPRVVYVGGDEKFRYASLGVGPVDDSSQSHAA